MTDIYIAGGGESLEELCQAHYGDLAQPDLTFCVDWVVAANPSLVSCGGLRPNQLVFLPESPADLSCDRYRAQIEAAWTQLSGAQKRVVRETLRNNHPGFWEALLDVLSRYEVVNRLGYINTFGAGAIGGVAQRASALADALGRVDAVLREYGSAHPMHRSALKPRVRYAYSELNRAFGTDLRAASARLKSSGRLGPLRSSRQGMQRAVLNAQKGSRAAIIGRVGEATRVLRVAKYGKVIGRGMLVLDLGIRAHNVMSNENRLRAGVSEGMGFAASFGAGGVVYTKCLGPAALLTGPWAVAICLLPAGGAALIADEFGKSVGRTLFDAATMVRH